MSIKRRIHTLVATVLVSQEPYEDGDGKMVFPENVESSVKAICRAESNTTDGRVSVQDGVNYEYSYLIFTDKDVEDIPNGSKVKVTVNKTGSVFGEGEVVKFERGQRVSRIWLK